MKTFKLKRATLPGLAALGLVAGTAIAVAATQTITDADELKDMRGVESASVKLNEVIAKAEAKSGDRAIEAGAEKVGDAIHYIVETRAADGTMQDLHYGLDGAELDVKADKVDDDDNDKADANVISNAKMTLGDAVTKAVQQTGGAALEAGVENENGNAVISVETVKGDQLTELRYNAMTGAVLSDDAPETKTMDEGEEDGERDNN